MTRITSGSAQTKALGEKIFLQSDQEWFARVSRDANPMHVDPVAARRLLAGHQVVHGIHTLLATLDLWRNNGGARPEWIQCEFANPVAVGERVLFTEHNASPGEVTITASIAGLNCTEVAIGLARSRTAAPADSGKSALVRQIGDLDKPLDELPGSQVGQAFAVHSGLTEELADRFPNAAAIFGPACVSAMAKLSYFVGMVCPGLHSVFSSVRFTVNAPPGEGDRLTFVVKKYDPRFRLFTIAFDGCLHGEILAFVRPHAQLQPSMQEIAAVVSAGEFRGTKSLVLGGSRGLGETVAKILAAGGGDILVTYARGASDARAVVDAINAFGRGRAQSLKLDLRTDAFEGLPVDTAALDSVYYFATPHIFQKKAARFDRLLFDDFIDFYVERFERLCSWLERGAESRKINVYLPSTEAVVERPKGMTEYAMAKAAAEVLAQDLNRSLNRVVVVCSRLPRLATDQTASIMTVSAASTLGALLPIVRAMNARSTVGAVQIS